MKYKFLSPLPPRLNSPQNRTGSETWREEDKETIKKYLVSPYPLFLLVFCLCLYGAATSVIAQDAQPKQAAKETKSGQPKSAAAEIRALLEAQVAAWNAGKLEEFMDGYWRSPDLTFFSAGRKLSGWDATIERYRKTYQAEGKEMGKLAFSELDIQQLGPNAAVVRGRWELTMADGKKPGGLYTLIFRRFKQGWKIVHDHTSSNQ